MNKKFRTAYIHLYMIMLLFLFIFSNFALASPIPIYGQVKYENSENVVDANVNITSDLGFLKTVTNSDGYFQLDCGDPYNWPIGTEINIKINKTENGRDFTGEKNTTVYSNYVDVGTILIFPKDNSNIKPEAVLSFDEKPTYFVDDNIIFDGSKSYDIDGRISEYRWVFTTDDESEIIRSEENKIIHVFNKPGVYDIILQVEDDQGLIDITTSSINISDDTSILKIILNETYLTYQNIFFKAELLEEKNIVNYSWDFGDGNYSYENITYHQYDKPGEYFVKLIVTDVYDQKYFDSKKISVFLDSDEDMLSDDVEKIVGSSNTYENDFKTIKINDYNHLIIDTDNDTEYDVFYNSSSNKSSDLKYDEKQYLIDDDNDDYYDYVYDPTDDSTMRYSSENKDNYTVNTPGFSYILFLFALSIVFIFYWRLNKK